jgi:hypothetical protein
VERWRNVQRRIHRSGVGPPPPGGAARAKIRLDRGVATATGTITGGPQEEGMAHGNAARKSLESAQPVRPRIVTRSIARNERLAATGQLGRSFRRRSRPNNESQAEAQTMRGVPERERKKCLRDRSTVGDPRSGGHFHDTGGRTKVMGRAPIPSNLIPKTSGSVPSRRLWP